MSESKWQTAQKHEREYFESGKNKQWQTPHSYEYWIEFLSLNNPTGIGLEVGCGPNGIFNYSTNILGADPINYSKKNFVMCVGEHLPFATNAFDYVICCNSLDHSSDPYAVMAEMFRVADKIIIWSNVFPIIVAKLMKYVDSTHPYHFSKDDFNPLPEFIACTHKIKKSIYAWHGKNATLKGKLKLLIASLLGVKGVCMHLEVKY